MTPTLQLFYDALQSLDIAQIMSVFHTNTTKLLGNKCGPASSDLCSYCIGDVFVPVQIETKLHKLFRSGSFAAFVTTFGISDMALRESSPICGKISNFYFYRMKVRCPPRHMSHSYVIHGLWQQSKNVAACKKLFLVDMGFIPLCSASKLCELERRGACLHPVPGIVVFPPFFESTPSVAPPEHFCSLVTPCLGYQKYSQAAVLLAAWLCAAQTGTPPFNFHRR
jgi:hypothetical protein